MFLEKDLILASSSHLFLKTNANNIIIRYLLFFSYIPIEIYTTKNEAMYFIV